MKSLPPLLAILAIVLLLIGGYVGAYLGMGERVDLAGPVLTRGCIIRVYPRAWHAQLFKPAAWFEGFVKDLGVKTASETPIEEPR